jgi:aminoglycoside N3'-acetyltransferase
MWIAEKTFPFLPRRAQKAALVSYRRVMRKRRRPKASRLVTKLEIASDLIRLGLKPGDVVFLHSSLTSIGNVSGGPNEVIDALMEVLGPDGTLAMPAFSQPYGTMLGTLEANEIFDPGRTPSTVGLIAETFRTRAGVRRSIHPTSSVCACGPKAAMITDGSHLRDSDFGAGTPLYKIMEFEGKILGLGVGLGVVSFYHVLEDVLRDKFPVKVRMDRVYNARALDLDGKLHVLHIRPLDPNVARTRIERNLWLQNLFKESLIDRGILRIGYVGHAKSWVINAKELYDAQMDLLRSGITIYTTRSEYEAIGLHRIRYVTDYRSASSATRHNYLEEQVTNAANGAESKGFWNEKSNNWVRQLNWNGKDWVGMEPHDWKYAIELQEGATQYALLTGSGALDSCLTAELRFITSRVNSDGSVQGLPDRHAPMEYEYGAVVSTLALGHRLFSRRDPILASEVLRSVELMEKYMSDNFAPTFDDPFSVILRAYANLAIMYESLGRRDKLQTVRRQIIEYARAFMNRQERNGLFPFDSAYGSRTSVHTQLKVAIALLLSFKPTQSDTFLISAGKNINWVLGNLQLQNGGLKWDSDNETNFFEIHQMLVMIAYRYLYELTNQRFDFTPNAIAAWKFLLGENASCTDLYLHNLQSTGAFFSYRHIDDVGNVQTGPYSSFKGSYEIGYSLWALALNRDLAL